MAKMSGRRKVAKYETHAAKETKMGGGHKSGDSYGQSESIPENTDPHKHDYLTSAFTGNKKGGKKGY